MVGGKHPVPPPRAPARLAPVLVALSILARACLAQDSYVALDRASYRGLSFIDPAGVVTALTPDVPWQHAHSLARDAAGNFIVTVDIFGAVGHNDGVYRVSPLGEITPVRVGEQFAEPSAVAIDAAGNYIVLNRTWEGSPQILRISPSGDLELLFEGRPMFMPTDIAIDAGGNYVITDRATRGRLYGSWTYLRENGAVYRFDPTSRQMTTVLSSVAENGEVKPFDQMLEHLTGIALDADGNYIVVEAPQHLKSSGEWETSTGDTCLLRLRPDGEILQTVQVPTLDHVYCIGLDVAIEEQGNYIVADAAGLSNEKGRLLSVTPAGQVTSLLLTSVLGIPGGVVILPRSTPSPPPPQIVDMSLIPGEDPPRIRFAWKSEPGQLYRIQHAPGLPSEAWQDVAFLISGTGDFIEFSDQCAGVEGAYYRIRLLNSTNHSVLKPVTRNPESQPWTGGFGPNFPNL